MVSISWQLPNPNNESSSTRMLEIELKDVIRKYYEQPHFG